MADIDWAVMCDYAFQDSSRKTCLIGIFDRVFAPAVPVALTRASLAVKVIGEPKENARVRIEIVRPTGGVLTTLQADVELGDNGASEIQASIEGLPLPDWGLYAINFYIGDGPPKTIGITVSKSPQSTILK